MAKAEIPDDWASIVDLVLRVQGVWHGIYGRCTAKSNRSWKDYGAKGIKICFEWSGNRGKIAFIKWALENGYRPGLDVDRIDNDLGYSPENCRFLPRRENCWNKTNNRILEYNGESKCQAAWGSDPRCVVPSAQFQQRVACGWDIERALFTPLRRR